MNEKNQHELFELLSAYLDGELGPDEAARAKALLRDDASARRLLEQLKQTVEVVSHLPRRAAPPTIVEELQLRLERQELIGHTPDPTVTLRRRWSTAKNILSMAAVLAVIVGVGSYLVQEREISPITPAPERLTSAPQQDTAHDLASRHESDTTETRRRRTSRSPEATTPETDPSHSGADASSERLASRSSRDETGPLAETSRKKDRSDEATVANAKGAELPPDLPSTAAFGSDPSGEDSVVILAVSVGTEQERQRVIGSLRARSEWHPQPTRDSNGDGGIRRDSKELTLRVPVRSLPGVLAQVEGDVQNADLSLEAGPLTVRGRERVRGMTEILAGAPDRPEQPTDDPEGGSGRLRQSDWNALLNLLGIDERTVESVKQLGDPPLRDDAPAQPKTPSDLQAKSDDRPGGSKEVDADRSDRRDKRTGLVGRRWQEVEEESPPRDVQQEHEPTDAEPESGPESATNRPITLTQSGQSDGTTGESEAPPADKSQAEEMITLIVRIEVDSSVGGAGVGNAAAATAEPTGKASDNNGKPSSNGDGTQRPEKPKPSKPGPKPGKSDAPPGNVPPVTTDKHHSNSLN